MLSPNDLPRSFQEYKSDSLLYASVNTIRPFRASLSGILERSALFCRWKLRNFIVAYQRGTERYVRFEQGSGNFTHTRF